MSGIFNDDDDERDLFSGSGVFDDKGPMFADGKAASHDDGPVTRAEERTPENIPPMPSKQPEVLPPDAPQGRHARDVTDASAPRRRAAPPKPQRRHGIAATKGPDGGVLVARTVDGKVAEPWRAPSPNELAHVNNNAKPVAPPAGPAGKPLGQADTSSGPGLWTWALVAGAVAGGWYLWKNYASPMMDAADEATEE